MGKDRFISAIVDLMRFRDRDLDRAIICALELLVDRSGAQLASLELREDEHVTYAREYRSLYAGHPSFKPGRPMRYDIGAPPLGTLTLVGPTDPAAVRELLALFASVLATQADRLVRMTLGRAPPRLHEAVRLFEHRYVLEVLHRHHGNMTATARALGIARSTLYELVEDLDVRRCVPEDELCCSCSARQDTACRSVERKA